MKGKNMKKKVCLIDGSGYIFRAFYALPMLTTPQGIPVNAVLGFMNMFMRLTAKIKCDYCLVLFDAKRQNEVDALVSSYRRLYKAISIVPYSEKLGEIVYFLELNGRRVTCSRKATLKSEYATNLQVRAIEDNLYKITYKYDYCLPEEENTIVVSQKVGSVTAKNTFYFDPK